MDNKDKKENFSSPAVLDDASSQLAEIFVAIIDGSKPKPSTILEKESKKDGE